jgi:cytochrome P450/NADPH-cytochrome P450 reductase
VRLGEALLFFGCDHPDVDFLYRSELEAWERAGVVSVYPAFSQAPKDDVAFVQHRLWKEKADVGALLAKGAHVYVCGDGRAMEPAVRETLGRIWTATAAAPAGGAEGTAGGSWESLGRYHADIFAS